MSPYLLQLFPSILLLFLLKGNAQTQLQTYCSGNSSDTTFKSNLRRLFTSIAAGAPKNGDFYNDTVGTGADKIYGLGICYADHDNKTTCNSCLSSVASNITTDCPDSKDVGYWQDVGPCFIRYSNQNFFGVANTTSSLLYNSGNYQYPEIFGKSRKALFDKLIANATASANMMSSGEESLTSFDKLNGLFQCTRDLNQQECYTCLNTFIQKLQSPSLYAYSLGVRFFGFSCYLHYEIQAVIPSGPSPSPGIADSVPGPNHASPPSGTGTKKPNITLIVAVVGGVATILVVIAICIWFRRKWSPLGRPKLLIELQEVAALEFQIYDLTAIRIATDNFSDQNKLGKGGFGPVFKGTLPNGKEIAVKRLSASSTQGITEFKNEVELLVRLRHNNLVQLLGCCISNDERMLCYEYLPNRSLDKILFGADDIKCRELKWSRRFRIIKGICGGLLYLHEQSPLKIVHRDLKASNILLDINMNPKIADFGLAKLFDRDQTHTITAHVAGSFGYIAPEYGMQGRFSDKSDTYSFGILVLEIVSGINNSSLPGSKYTSGLINHVWKNWIEGKVLEIKDPTLDQECKEEVTKCIHIAFLCLQANPSNRPNIETVTNMFNSSSIVSLPPLPPPRSIWGADVSSFEDDENVSANLRREFTIVGVETAMESFLSSFNRRA